MILFLFEVRDSVEQEFKELNNDQYDYFRIPVFYLSNLLPLAILCVDFGMNGLKMSYKLVFLNIFLLILYFFITILGELIMGEPIYI